MIWLYFMYLTIWNTYYVYRAYILFALASVWLFKYLVLIIKQIKLKDFQSQVGKYYIIEQHFMLLLPYCSLKTNEYSPG